MKKSEKLETAILTHSNGPQGNLKQLFFCANSKSKIVVSVDGAYASKDKMVCIWPTFKKKLIFYISLQVPYL
jgi:hypothetical protein